MTVVLLWLQLAGAAAVILVAATFLAKSADGIAFKTGLGRAFIGVILLATATSLPELGTGVSSIALFDEPDLAAGDAFGSNLFNLLIIGLLDLYWRNGPILNSVSMASAIIGALGIAVISLAAIAVLVHGMTSTMSTLYVSPFSVVTVIVFLAAMYTIYRFDQRSQPGDTPDSADEAQEGGDPDEHEYANASMARVVITYVIAASTVVGVAIWLASAGDRVATAMGWEASFVGTQFLAFSTSLPELAASFAAIRIRAPEMAITGVLGSNLFNMGFILFMDDLAFTEGAIWANISAVHPLTALMAVLMTAVVIFAVVSRGRSRPSTYWTVEALLLIGLYVGASILVFLLAV